MNTNPHTLFGRLKYHSNPYAAKTFSYSISHHEVRYIPGPIRVVCKFVRDVFP